MLPLSLLRTAQGHPILVELKNGETYNGQLVNCDSFMNINLKKVIHTSKYGDKFWRIAEVYIRGYTIKYLSIPEPVIDMVSEDIQSQRSNAEPQRMGRGGRGSDQRGGRGGNRGGRGGDRDQGRGGMGGNRGGRGDNRDFGRGGRGDGRGGRGGRGDGRGRGGNGRGAPKQE